MKRLTFALLIVFLMYLFAGCSGARKENTVTITLLVWGNMKARKTITEQLNRFERENPSIHVHTVDAAPSRYRDKLLCMVAGEKSPDVAMISSSWSPLATEARLFEPLDDLIKKNPDFDVHDFYEPVIQGWCKYHGTWYCFPIDADMNVLFYNRQMFNKYGIPYPDETWDWAKLLWAAKKLSKFDRNGKQYQWGISFGDKWSEFVWQNGGEVFSADGRKCLLDKPRAYQAVQFLVDLQNKYHVAPNDSDEADMGGEGLFTDGKLGMVIRGSWKGSVFNDQNVAVDWDIAPIPKGHRRAVLLRGSGYAMVRGTRHKEEAWKLLSFLCSKEGTMTWALGTQSVPIRRSVAELLSLRKPKGKPMHPVDVSSAMAYSRAYPNEAAVPEIMHQIISNEMELALLGRQDVRSSCIRASQRANQLLTYGHL